jgi:hypothetical protein
MNQKRFVTLAVLLLVAAAFPATAAAIVPPDSDDYLDSLILNDEQHPLKYNEGRFFTADTTTYTIQEDMYEAHGTGNKGGPAEPNICTNSHGVRSEYGHTVWAAFYANRWGRMTIGASSGTFDEVIGIIPFRSLQNAAPDIGHGACYDEKRGFTESASGIVTPGQWYAVQVGGTPPSGGPMQITYKLRKPARVGSSNTRANLVWLTGPLRVKQLYITNVPRGARLKLSCTKHACRKKTIKVRHKTAAGKFAVPAGSARPADGKVSMRRALGVAASPSPHAAFKPIVHESAKRVTLLRNKKVKRGAKIELRLTSFGHIGRYYRWNVKRNKITPQINRCMNPGSSKPRKKCSG